MNVRYSKADEFDERPARGTYLFGLRSWLHVPLLLALLVSSHLITFSWSTSILKDCSANSLASIYNAEKSPSRRRFFAGIDDRYHLEKLRPFSLTPSKYTASPSKAVDDAWSILGVDYDPFLVPTEAASEFSLTDDHVNLTANGDTTPREGYVANMEGLHQLHCVNLLRQSLWYNHDYYSKHSHTHVGESFGDDPKIVIGHVNHCIDMLREVVMCRAEADVVPYLWVTREGDTIPDFAHGKMCRNFESLRSWAEEHQADIPGDNETAVPSNVRLFGEISHNI